MVTSTADKTGNGESRPHLPPRRAPLVRLRRTGRQVDETRNCPGIEPWGDAGLATLSWLS